MPSTTVQRVRSRIEIRQDSVQHKDSVLAVPKELAEKFTESSEKAPDIKPQFIAAAVLGLNLGGDEEQIEMQARALDEADAYLRRRPDAPVLRVGHSGIHAALRSAENARMLDTGLTVCNWGPFDQYPAGLELWSGSFMSAEFFGRSNFTMEAAYAEREIKLLRFLTPKYIIKEDTVETDIRRLASEQDMPRGGVLAVGGQAIASFFALMRGHGDIPKPNVVPALAMAEAFMASKHASGQ